MLRNVYPDEPGGDDNVAAADTPGEIHGLNGATMCHWRRVQLNTFAAVEHLCIATLTAPHAHIAHVECGIDCCIIMLLPCTGAFFAEFLPKDIKVLKAVSGLTNADQGDGMDAAATADSATAYQPQPTACRAAAEQQQQQLEGDENTLSDQTTHECTADAQVKLEGQQTAAQAAAAAQASAAEATAAACAAASKAAQQAAAAAGADHAAPSDAVQAAEGGAEDTDSDFDIPSIAEIRSALAESWFGNGEAAPEGTSTTNGKAAGGEAQQDEEEDEGLLEKLLPFGKDGPLRRKTAGLVPTFKAKHKPKPLRLKLAEQVGVTLGKLLYPALYSTRFRTHIYIEA